MAGEREALFQRSLYVFDLPEELLATLSLDHQSSHAEASNWVEQATDRKVVGRAEGQDGSLIAANSCALCGLKFVDLSEQRSHARSDLHRFNLKRRMKGLNPVGEAEFERLLMGELEESLSGSDSSDPDSHRQQEQEMASDHQSIDRRLAALLNDRGTASSLEQDEGSPNSRKRPSGKSPLLFFTASALPADARLGVYRALFTAQELEDESRTVGAIMAKQLPWKQQACIVSNNLNEDTRSASTNAPHFFLCMLGGGHFAGMVIALTPKLAKRSSGLEEREFTVLARKTFHRYTTRRKQGGSQSTNDSAKGAAHSAGSSLRRYNEMALMQEIRGLLADWRELIESSQLLFVRATGAANRRTVFGPYEGQVMHINDPRIRGFPFSTRRATQAELMRAFIELTRPKISRADHTELAPPPNTEPSASSTAPPTKSARDRKAQNTVEEEELVLHTYQISSLIRRNKVAGLLSYLSSNRLSANFRFHPPTAQQHHHSPTPLHLAAAVNHPSVVLGLLLKGGADPTILNGEGRTAFEIGGDRATRDAFRVARDQLGEDAWDWGEARVPSSLTREESEVRARREGREADAKEKQRRAREVERLRIESQPGYTSRADSIRDNRKVIGTNTLQSGAEMREEEARGMPPDVRMRLERERRARAAEDRIKNTQQR